jgi:type VI secretion system secreted protein VgrG
MTSSLLSQHARLISIETAQGSHLPESLVVESFTGYEAVNALFSFDIQALSVSATIDLKPFIGEEITLRLLQADGSKRVWHGYCTEAAWLGADGGMARYHLRLAPFLSFLSLRRDAYIFQDMDAQQIVTELLAEYPQAQFVWDVTQQLTTHPIYTQYRESDLEFFTRLLASEGLNWRFEHDQGSAQEDTSAESNATSNTTSTGHHAKHKLVIFDSQATAPAMAGDATVRFHAVRATESSDSIHQFTALRQVQANAVSLASWHSAEVQAPAAELASSIDNGDLPDLPVYQGAAERLYTDANHADQHSELHLQALSLDNKTFAGAGAVRSLAAGAAFSLSQHAHYPEGENTFTVLSVSHAATNNFTTGLSATGLSEIQQASQLERGIYRNTFTCVRNTVPLVPPLTAMRRRPTALGAQSALVVGLADATLTTERDHRIKVQFPWQRGVAPLAGGLTETGNLVDTTGNAPNNETSGTWVRVAEALSGPNWGSNFTPRIGSEVLVDFIEGDMDRPVIVAALYNGADLPPYAAGVDAGVNHAGVLSGMHSQAVAGLPGEVHSDVNGDGYNQWVLDDTQTQGRMRLASSTAASQLNMGYLVAQSPYSAARGHYRGQGFELRSDAWGVLRGVDGVLLSTTARVGLGGSVASTQMDMAEPVAQLQGAQSLSAVLIQAANHQSALSSEAANQAQLSFMANIDQQQQGKYTANVNGQAVLKAQLGSGAGDDRSAGNGRTLDALQPVERFNAPLVHIDSASSVHWASPASTLLFAGQHLQWSTQDDTHWAAGHTLASVSGHATSLFSHSGGIQAFAGNGALSVQAHTDSLEILADKEVVVTSSNGHIVINAKQKVSLQAGQSSVTLEGGNITFACPGLFSVKAGVHAFMGGGRKAAMLRGLPSGLSQISMPSSPLESVYSQALDYTDVPSEWLPFTFDKPVTVRIGSEKIGVLDREQGDLYTCGVITKEATEVNYWIATDNAWRVEEVVEQAHDDGHWDEDAE